MHNKTVTQKEIAEDLRTLGVRSGQILLVHSALRRFGHVEGGANAVIDALLDAIGPKGTVMVPTLTGSSELSPTNPPVFNVRNTPCWTGKIPETFRHRPEAVRSLHPTHSVAAIGARAHELTRDHEKCVTPCGQGSPYDKLAKSGGSVLLLGVDLSCCTLLHTVEEIAQLPYHLQEDWVKASITDENSKTKTIRIKIHRYGDERDFRKLEPILLHEKAMRIGTIGQADIRLINAQKLVDITLARLANDPNFLLRA